MGEIVDNAGESAAASSSTSVLSAVQRIALLYDPSGVPKVQNEQGEEEDDKFFEVTAEDLRLMLKALNDESKRQNAMLPTTLLKERDRQLKQKAYKRTIVRFRLHTGHILQAHFLSTEPVSALFAFLGQAISPTLRFELRQIPSAGGQLSADDSVTSLLDADIAPKSVLVLKIVADENSPDPLAKSAEQIFVPGFYQNCTQTEALEDAEQWLSSNTEFCPYLNTILDMLPSPTAGSSATRTAPMPPTPLGPSSSTQNNGTDGSTNIRSANEKERTRSNSELPKWLKRK